MGGLAEILPFVARHLLQEEPPPASPGEAVPPEGEGIPAEGEVADPGIVATLIAWQVAILFLGFVTITIIWEFCIALLTYFTVSYTGRKALWVTRLKDEILALGVITLTLVVIEASLANICVEGVPESYSSEEFPDHPCPEGQHLLFTRWRILQTHLLLFAVAVVFILYACTSLYICIFRLRFWRRWEAQAKVGAFTDIGAPIIFRRLCSNGFAHFFRMALWNSLYSNIHQETYTMLRLVFRIRMDGANLADPLPRQANFLNIVEQAMEVNFSEAAQYSWVLSIGMAIFLSIPIHMYALYWLFGISALVMMLCAAKLQSIVVHLSAMAYFDLHPELQSHVQKFIEFDHKHREAAAQQPHRHSIEGHAANDFNSAPSTIPMLPMGNPTSSLGNMAQPDPSIRVSMNGVDPHPAPAPAPAAPSEELPTSAPAVKVEPMPDPDPDPESTIPAPSPAPAPAKVDVPAEPRANGHSALPPIANERSPVLGGGGGPVAEGVRHEFLAGGSWRDMLAGRRQDVTSGRGTRVVPVTSWQEEPSAHSVQLAEPSRTVLLPPELDEDMDCAPVPLTLSGGRRSPVRSDVGPLSSKNNSPRRRVSMSRSRPVGEGNESDATELHEPLSPHEDNAEGQANSKPSRHVRISQVTPDSPNGEIASGGSHGDGPATSPTDSQQNSRSLRALMAAGIDQQLLHKRSFRQPPPPWWRRWLCCGAGSRRHHVKDPSLKDPNYRPAWHVETPYEKYRRRLSGRLKDDDGKIVRNISGLFWLSSPTFLLWLFQCCYMENSLSLTILLYGLIRDATGVQKVINLVGIIVLILLDIGLLVFASTAVLPVYALVSTTATCRPQALIEEIRVQKMLFDKEDYEEGIGGWLLRVLRIVKPKKELEEGQQQKVDTEFILMLADQAGVVTAFGNFVAYPLKYETIYREFALTWQSEADHWDKYGKRQTANPIVKGNMTRFRDTFEWLDMDREEDDDGSGFGITAKELGVEMRRLGTRCTMGELHDMIAQVDFDGSEEIGFQEYVLFMCFKFFDHDNDGVLDIRDIAAAMGVLGHHHESKDIEEYTIMIKFIEHANQEADWHDGRPAGRVELDEFLRFFNDVQFEHEELPEETALGSPLSYDRRRNNTGIS